MNKYILLFRGINVSGHKIIKMAELKSHLESIGLKNVITYIQSGNVIFDSDISDIKLLESKIKELIFLIYNFEVDIFITTKDVIESAINNIPFIGNEFEIKSVYIGFMISDYDTENYTKLQSIDFGIEKFKVINNILYFYIPNGQQKSKFSNNFFENKLKTRVTTRNVNTCNKLIELSK